jgi:Zn-dependent M32 family carboxypeptidase
MVDDDAIVQLTLRAASHRQRAQQARRLAEQINDALAHHQLLEFAAELERQAEDFEVEAAVLTELKEEEARAA